MFTISCDGDIVATTDTKLYVGCDLRKNVERCLREITKSVDTPVLAYSGGLDSAYVLRVMVDMGIHKSIRIAHGVFTSNGNILNYDSSRGIRYAEALGVDVDVVELNLTDDVIDEIDDLADNAMPPAISPATIVQEYWRRRIDGTIIKADCCPGISGPVIQDRFKFNRSMFLHTLPDSNSVDIFAWDEEILSAFMNERYVRTPPIDIEPFGEIHGNPYNVTLWSSRLQKWLTYLNDFPDLQQIFGKFPTVRKDRENLALVDYMDRRKKHHDEGGYISIRGERLDEGSAERMLAWNNEVIMSHRIFRKSIFI